jgi:hypothetical protein
MSTITDMVQEHLGDNGLAQLAQHLGVDPSTAQAAVAAAIPMLTGAMSQAGSGGAPVPAATAGNPAGGLGGLLGGSHADISQQVSQKSGLDIHTAEKALLFLAPIVMAQLAKRQGAAAPAAPGAAPAQEQAQQPQSGLGAVLGAVERMFHKGS